MIAYLFLTYDNILHKEAIFNAIGNNYMYIHAVNPEKVEPELQPYLTQKHVKTSWGDISIAHATLVLLKEALFEKETQWFVLLSQDAYPLVKNAREMESKIKSKKLSCFDFICYESDIYKTSQWWIMTRKDAETVVKHATEFEHQFHSFSRKHICVGFEYAIDEIYFLSLLRWVDPNYQFRQEKPVYTRWLHNIHMHHPVIFQKITKYDVDEFHRNRSLFLRKTTADFQPVVHKQKPTLLFIYLTKARCVTYNYGPTLEKDVDIVLLHSGLSLDTIPENLRKRCLYIYDLYYPQSYGAYLEIYHDFPVRQWKYVFMTYHYFDINYFPSLPINMEEKVCLHLTNTTKGFRENMEMENEAAFYEVLDAYHHRGYFLHNMD